MDASEVTLSILIAFVLVTYGVIATKYTLWLATIGKNDMSVSDKVLNWLALYGFLLCATSTLTISFGLIFF